MKVFFAAIALLVALPRPAHADLYDFWRDIRWAVDLDLATRYAADVEEWDDASAERLHQVAGNIELRGLAGKRWWTVAAAIDTEFGFEIPGAFVYGVHLSPLGLGLRLGDRAYLGVLGGVGFGGVTGRVPFAGEFPLDAFLSFDLGGWVRVEGLARAIYTTGSDARDAGSTTFTFADEGEVRLGLAIGKRHHQYGTAWSDGTYVGFFAREQMGERIIGVMFAISGNGADRRGR